MEHFSNNAVLSARKHNMRNIMHISSTCVDALFICVFVWQLSYFDCAVWPWLAAPATVWSFPWVFSAEPRPIVSDSSTDPAMTASTPRTSPSLKLPWCSPGAWPQPCPRNSSPCRWALSWLSASTTSAIKFPFERHKRCHFWQWSPYVLILEQLFSHCDTHIVAQCCPCKTGTNTQALNTNLGGRDRKMTAISKVYTASQCLSPQGITRWPQETSV